MAVMGLSTMLGTKKIEAHLCVRLGQRNYSPQIASYRADPQKLFLVQINRKRRLASWKCVDLLEKALGTVSPGRLAANARAATLACSLLS